MTFVSTIDQNQFLTPTDARLVGGVQSQQHLHNQQQQAQAFTLKGASSNPPSVPVVNVSVANVAAVAAVVGPSQTQPLPLAHQATLSSLDKYYGQQQQASQPLPTNATINGSNGRSQHHLASNEVDEKLKGFNIHQLRTLAKHKSISTSINKDPMIEKIKSVYRFKSASEVLETLTSLSSQARPYQYALLEPDTNAVLTELRKMNDKFDSMAERIDTIERGQRELRELLAQVGLLYNQTQLSRQIVNNQSHHLQRNRNTDYNT